MSSYRPLRFLDASARADEIVANYKLGIGTHSQSSEVHVLADAPEIRIQDEVSEVTETALRITADGGAVSFQSGVDFTNDSKGDIKFESMLGATTHMTIDGTNSRVGIGTTNPRTYLHLSANNGDPLVTEGDFIGTHTLTEYLRFTSMGDSGDVNAVSVGFKLGADDNSDASPDGRLDICANDGSTAGNSYGFVPDRTIATFLGGGKVGIGLTNPNRPLTVENADDFYLLNLKRTTAGGGSAIEIVNGDDDKWTVGTGGTGTFGIYNGSTFGEQFTIDTNGKVGIGTTSPNTLVELSKATGSATISPTELRLSTTTNAADWSVTDPWARLSFYTDDVTGDAPGVMASVGAVASSADGGENTRLAFFTAEPHVERMCIDRYGNVGIGTTSPVGKLDVITSGSATSGGNVGDWDDTFVTIGPNGGSRGAAIAFGAALHSSGYATYTSSLAPTTSWCSHTHRAESWYWIHGSTQKMYLANNGNLTIAGSYSPSSDDRIKTEEEHITNATDVLLKLKPQKYRKHNFEFVEVSNEAYENAEDGSNILVQGAVSNAWVRKDDLTFDSSSNVWYDRSLSNTYIEEAGLIAQDIWYDAPELRYIVKPSEEAVVNETRGEVSDDPQVDPDYSDWGRESAYVNYTALIPYLIKSNQELYSELQTMKARLDALENP
jgi:hypothetical protein